MAWINWLLKPKCMLIYIYFEVFLCCMKIWCKDFLFFIYFGETRPCAWKQNIYFFILFFNVLTKIKYFNTGFVSLQYKNTNWYWSKCSNEIAENHRFFWKVFWNFNFFLLDRTRLKRRLGWNRPEIKRAYFVQGWTQSSHMGWANIPVRNNSNRVTVHESSNRVTVHA